MSNTNATMDNSTINSKITVYDEFIDMPIFDSDDGLKLYKCIIAYGFEHPSYIQKRGIMPVASGMDIIGQAQSGTGKTGTFSIGTLSRINHNIREVQAIILSPTHELAIQTFTVIKNLSRDLKTRCELCIGKKISVDKNISGLRKGKHIIIGTPGRVCDLVSRNVFDLSCVKMIVLDEADKLLSDRFHEKVAQILMEIDNARASIGKSMQICIFSATMPVKVVKLSDQFMNNPVKILLQTNEVSLDGIKQYVIDYKDHDKKPFNVKVDIIEAINKGKAIPQCIVYVNSRRYAEDLEYALSDCGMQVAVIHGGMDNLSRENVIKEFRAQKSRILIATDLLARGIDIQQVSVVINFDLPYTRSRDGKLDKDKISEYIHRIGRGGRFGRKGVAINLVTTQSEEERLYDIKKYFQVTMEPFPEPDDLDRVFG